MIRIAVVQTKPEFGKVRENVAAGIELIESTEADLYVLPELFNTGYNFINREEAESLAEPAEGETFQGLCDVARRKSCHIVYGFPEMDGKLYNSALLVGPGGRMGLYRKIHLYYRETLFFEPGNLGFPVVDLPWGKLGIMICFDWIFPESARTLALKGALIIAHPSNLVLPHCPDAMVTRCLENRVFAATANRVGVENRGGLTLRYTGNSEVVSPRGEVLFRMGAEETAIQTVEIDPNDATSKKLNEYNDILSDRRVAEYQK